MIDKAILIDIVQLLVLAWIVIKSRGWDAPSLKANLDSLYREFGYLKRKLNEVEINSNSNTTELEIVRGRIVALDADLRVIQNRVTKGI